MEAALTFPILLLMCCGTMDFARVVYAGIAVASAARAGVQFGSLTPGNTGKTSEMVQAALDDAANQGLTGISASARSYCLCGGSTAEVACSSTCSGATPNGYTEVTVSYTFTTMLSYPGLPNNIVVNRTAKMRAQ